MADITCVDGSVLAVLPLAVLDRDGVPYEVTLRLERHGEPFGEVGERCGYFLASTTARLAAARRLGNEFPMSSLEAGLRAWTNDHDSDPDSVWEELQRYLPRDRELFCFRARDPDDLSTVGELRVTLREERLWTEQGWTLRCLAMLEAWGAGGQGARALLDSEGLLAFLTALVQDFADVGATYEAGEDAAGLRRPVG